ncbi:hypothetical protein V2J09_009904 [Rumex salicifolius]
MDPDVNVKESGAKALEFIEEVSTNCDAVQEKVLSEILRRNADTEYLKRHRLEGRTDRHTFKNRVPVVTYEDIQPDIQRIANGDFSPILSSEPISEFLTSSGTSGGERKLIPITNEEFDRRDLFLSLLKSVINLYYPGMDNAKALCFLFIKAETKTPGGLVARPALTSYYKSSHFKNRVTTDPYYQYTSPTESILCLNSFQSMYSQMLSGLYQRLDVLRVGAVFASGLLRAIRFLHLNYTDLCHDIATGTLSPKITDPSIQQAISEIMKPDPDLARKIEQECSRKNWEAGIIKRIWPNTKYLEMIVTGTMAQYIPMLDYYSGGLPIASTFYGSSECYSAINLKPTANPLEVTYTIMPNMGYFEFMPLDTSSTLALVDLADVEVGKDYELVITTYAGLYRFRTGDVLRPMGFHNAAPEFQFVRRKNVLLSIDSDKTDEAELQKAVDSASLLLRQSSDAYIAEYTTYADTKTIPGNYVVYMELMMSNDINGRWPTDELLRRCCLEMEESLNSVYRQCRVADGSIGPLEIRVVRPRTFEEVMDYAIARGASINQYKVPRCVRLLPILEILDRGVVSAHFSPALPRWSPGVGGGDRA